MLTPARQLSEPSAVQPRVDYWLLGAALALLLVGVVMIASASMDYAGQRYGEPLFFLHRHLVYIVLALALSLIAFRFPMALWQRLSPLLLLSSIAVLLLILVPGVGHTANNATRWLALGPFTLQGSELAKLAVVAYLGSYLVRQQELVKSRWMGIISPMIVMVALVVLLLLQPDFGAVVVLFGTALGMLFLGGARLWQFSLVLLASLLAAVAMVASSPYRMDRWLAFLNPWADQFGEGYQLTQSLIAFGRGEWFGLGLGNSIQKLFYLPEAHTDFIFAILAEELGLLGCFLTLALYAVVVVRILLAARRAESGGNAYSAYVAYGIALIFSAQLFINVGVNIGLLPTKGLTLPFLSYGGSSLLVSCIAIALVSRVVYECNLQYGDLHARRSGAIARAAIDSSLRRKRSVSATPLSRCRAEPVEVVNG